MLILPIQGMTLLTSLRLALTPRRKGGQMPMLSNNPLSNLNAFFRCRGFVRHILNGCLVQRVKEYPGKLKFLTLIPHFSSFSSLTLISLPTLRNSMAPEAWHVRAVLGRGEPHLRRPSGGPT